MSLSCHCVLLPHTPPLILPCSAFAFFLPPAHLFPNLCTQHFSHLTSSSEPVLSVFQTREPNSPHQCLETCRALVPGSGRAWDHPLAFGTSPTPILSNSLEGGQGWDLWPQLVSHPLQSTVNGATVSPEPSETDLSLCLLRNSLPSILGSHLGVVGRKAKAPEGSAAPHHMAG